MPGEERWENRPKSNSKEGGGGEAWSLSEKQVREWCRSSPGCDKEMEVVQ